MRPLRLLVPLIIALLLVLTRAAGVAPVRAAGPWYVAPGGNDTNDCASPATACASINGALNKPGFVAGETIKVAIGTYTGTGAGVVLLSKSATLSGGWDASFGNQTSLSTVDGQNTRRGIVINSGVSATIERFSVRNGMTTSSGGGILNLGTMTLYRSSVVRNTAGDPCCMGSGGGGGIYNNGIATLTETTVSNNVILGWFQGSGIYTLGTLTLNNSTVSSNTGGDTGAVHANSAKNVTLNNTTIINNHESGLYNLGSNVLLRNSILSNNSGSGDCDNGYSDTTPVTSLGYNIIQKNLRCATVASDLVGVDPKLSPLGDYGGLTSTHIPLSVSPAINAGNPGGCLGSAGLLTTDQRGYARNGRCDIGATEFQRLEESTKRVILNPGLTPGEPIGYAITVKNSSSALISNIRMTDTLPFALTYLTNSLTATSGTTNQSGGTITWAGSLSAGAAATITFTALSNPALPIGARIVNSAVIGDGIGVITNTATAMVGYKTFFPFISTSIQRVKGHVMYQGAAASGIPLELRFYDGATWSTRMTAVTSPDGSYVFNEVLAPSAGQRYYVRYRNSTNPNYVSSWSTRLVTSSTDGYEVSIGDFDIANIQLHSPASGAYPSLPLAFQWARRSATPSDSYEFNLLDPADGSPWWWSPPQGYVNTYTLTGLPAGFTVGTWYIWFVGVYSPDGGYGESYYARTVRFSTAGTPPASRAEPMRLPAHRDPIEDGVLTGRPVLEPPE